MLALLPIITPPFAVDLGLNLLFGRAELVNELLEWAFDITPTRWFYGLLCVWLAQMFVRAKANISHRSLDFLSASCPSSLPAQTWACACGVDALVEQLRLLLRGLRAVRHPQSRARQRTSSMICCVAWPATAFLA